MKNSKYLRLRGNVWYYQRILANGKLFSKSLKTDSKKEAIRHKDILDKEFSLSLLEIDKQHPQKRLRKLIHELRQKREEIENHPDVMYFDDIYSAEDAAKSGDKILADAILHAGGGNTLSPLSGVKLDYTIEEVAIDFLEQVEKTKNITTFRAYKRGLHNFTLFNNKQTYLKDITRNTVLNFIAYLVKIKQIKQKSISNQLGGLSGCFDYAANRDYIAYSNNPFKGHKLTDIVPQVNSEPSNEPFTLNEYQSIQSIINASKRVTEARKWMPAIALMSGLRFKELLGIYKEDIREINGIWCFDINPTEHRRLKNGNAKRLVPIHDAILPTVLSLKESSSNQFLFEEVISNKTIGGTFQTWFSRVKNEHLPSSNATFHGLRKNFVTAMEISGVEEIITATLVGHSKHGITYNLYSKGHGVKLLHSELHKITAYFEEFINTFPKLDK